MSNTVRWDVVAEGLKRSRHRILWRPYGFPEVVDPSGSAFFEGEVQPRWDIPEKMIISCAITGAFFTRQANPAQPITPTEIRDSARECLQAGASCLHIHVRDDRGYNVLSQDRFEQVIDPLRDEFPNVSVDGCLVTAGDGEWDEMQRTLDARVLDGVPLNPTCTYCGDSILAKPIPVLLEKTRRVLEAGAKPIIAVYTDGDVSNADRYLFRSGLVPKPSYWNILPALPGGSPMDNPRQMVDGLMRLTSLIYDVDPEATIMVCAAGRASSYLVTVAAALGLHIRVGMEDTVWRWPHKNEKLASNLQALETAKLIAQSLGRDIASYEETRKILKMPEKSERITRSHQAHAAHAHA